MCIRDRFYSIDAISVIALQMPVSKIISHNMTKEHNATSFIVKSLGIYGISFALFACGVSSYWWICIISLVVFSIAECIYAPLINIALVEAQPDKDVYKRQAHGPTSSSPAKVPSTVRHRTAKCRVALRNWRNRKENQLLPLAER